MPKQSQRQAIVCCHAVRCECNDCQIHMIEWFELLHDMDVLAARDPVSHQQWLADLDRFVDSDPEPMGVAS